MSTWLSDVVKALNDLGGLGHYSDIYDRVAELRNGDLPKSWHAIIRRTIETYSSDSDAYGKKNDYFYTVKGKGTGTWGLREYTPSLTNVDLTEDDISFPEGKKMLRQHVLRERNPKLVLRAKELFLSKHHFLFCEVCNFNFEAIYGELGKGFIEAHHIKPISELTEGEKTSVNDLIMVCSNCHKMLHRKRPWITQEQLQKLLIQV
jgi:putative restriction endonuclease